MCNKIKILKNKWTTTNTNVKENLQNEEKILTGIEKICPPWVPTNPDYFPNPKPNELSDRQFSFAEFNTALNSRNSKSAPGIDGFTYKVIKNLPVKFKLLLLDIFNEMYVSNSYPPEWKEFYIHLVSKSDSSSVRPIALSSNFCKLFETLNKNRLMYWVESKKILPPSQTGFRKGQSCIENVVNITLYVEEGLMYNKDTLAAFLDVRSAFDNVNSEILIDKLASIECSSNIIKFIKFITFQRVIHADIFENDTRLTFKKVYLKEAYSAPYSI